jgi:hypothetical protein
VGPTSMVAVNMCRWRNLQPDGPWVTDGVSLTTNTACWQGGVVTSSRCLLTVSCNNRVVVVGAFGPMVRVAQVLRRS